VTLWAYEPEVAATIRDQHCNPLYLPGVTLPPLAASADLATVCSGAELLLLVVPAQVLRSVCRQIAGLGLPPRPLVICCKGVELSSSALMSDVVTDELPGWPLAALSGPTFAAEVARGLPTAVTVASADLDLAEQVVAALGSPMFRPYASPDLVGAELGGAIKNVLAIACGVVEGRGLGDNARAALITRGLAEMARLCVALGGQVETCMGLAGLGDLMLTASSTQSRNYSLGVALGQGRALAEILAARRAVTEGVPTAAALISLAERYAVDMPICRAVYKTLHCGQSLDEAIRDLLARPFRSETLSPRSL